FTVLAGVVRLFPFLNIVLLANLLAQASNLFKLFGTLNGSVSAWVTDSEGKVSSLALVAPQEGPRVASAPAVLLTKKLIADGAPKFGAYPCIGFLNIAEISEFLEPFGISLIGGVTQ
ncbi:MAG: hypothetical protein AAF485_08465, partial [Chloroflexota bacterium]